MAKGRRLNGEGSIVWHKGTKRYMIEFGEGGKRRYSYALTMARAKEKQQEIRRKKEDGVRLTQSRMPLGEYLQVWLDRIRPTLRDKSYSGYESIVRVHLTPRLGHIRLNKLMSEHISRAWSDMVAEGKSYILIEHCHNRLSKALKDAKSGTRKLIAINPIEDVRKPAKSKRRMTPLDSVPEAQRYLDENGYEVTRMVSEIDRVLEEAKRIDKERASRHSSGYMPIIYTALNTGMRRNELLALEWKDVDLENGKIHVTKSLKVSRGGEVSYEEPKTNSGRRSIKMPPELTARGVRFWEWGVVIGCWTYARGYKHASGSGVQWLRCSCDDGVWLVIVVVGM